MEKRKPIILLLPIKSLFTYLLLFCLVANSWAAGIVAKDSSRVEVRRPSAIKQENILKDRDYVYDKIPPAPKTPWERFVSWLQRKFSRLFMSDGFSNFWGVFQYILLAAAVLLIVWLLVKNDVRGLFYGKSAPAEIGFREVTENIHEIDFDKLISEAVASKNFRRAVRLYFLRVLKELSDREIIRWKADKTNYDYYLELRNSKHELSFRDLSFLYECIWYGDFSVSEETYLHTSEKFKKFQQQIKG